MASTYYDNLKLAASSGDVKLVKTLINANATINLNAGSSDLRRRTQTPLHYASINNHSEVIKVLVKAKANINAKDADGLTPLQHAIRRGHQDAALILMSAGAESPRKRVSEGGLVYV